MLTKKAKFVTVALCTLFIAYNTIYSMSNSLFAGQKVCSKYLISYTLDSTIVYEKWDSKIEHSTIYIVRRKAKSDPCSIDSNSAFFKLKDQQHGNVEDFFDHYLLTNSCYGANYIFLKIFDINSGQKILDTAVCDSITRIGKDTLSLWFESADTAFSKCPNKAECDGIGIAIMVEHYFNLKTHKLYKTANWHCSCRE